MKTTSLKGNKNPKRATAGPAAPVRFTEHLIAGGYNYCYGIATGDLDGDGDMDIVSADGFAGLYWFENDGKGNFTKHVIRENNKELLERLCLADMNGDGRLDVVIIDNINGHVLWFENPPDPRKSPWQMHAIERDTMPGAYDVTVGDIMGNGTLSVIASSWRKGNQFAWYEKRWGDWIKHVIDHPIAETRTVRAVDINGDGRLDVLGTGSKEGEVVWYANPGDPIHKPWKKTVIDSAARPIHGHPVDMDGDGGVDVVMALGMGALEANPKYHQVVWYEHGGRPELGPWKKHIIAEHFPNAFEAVAGDLDGDGQIEVVASSWAEDGRLAIFKHDGDPRGKWTMQVLREHWPLANQVLLADLDGDGRLDILACAERGSNELRWWRNEGPANK